MADIEKGLPNIKDILPGGAEEVTDVNIADVPLKGPIEVTSEDDGGATIDFDPSANLNIPGTESHFDNLADLLPDEVTDPIGSELRFQYQDNKTSRKEWEQTYTQGLDLLGFKYENRTEPFQGASGATHPVLAEAVTQFQATAYKELMPADGPVRTQVMGAPNPGKTQQAERVKDFMNYQIMDQMKEYEAEFDQMLFYLPLAGSAFKKVYYDELMGRAVSKFVPADDLVVPYTATSLDDAESVIHMVRMSENELRKQQVGGFYRDIELSPGYLMETEVEKKERALEGVSRGRDEKIYTLLECHVNLDLEGFEDVNPQSGDFTGIKLPYVVTLEEGEMILLSPLSEADQLNLGESVQNKGDIKGVEPLEDDGKTVDPLAKGTKLPSDEPSLTDDQKAKLETAQTKMREKMDQFRAKGLPREEAMNKIREIRETHMAELKTFLTKQQIAELEKKRSERPRAVSPKFHLKYFSK